MKYCEARPGDCPNEAICDLWGLNPEGHVQVKAYCGHHRRAMRLSARSMVTVDRRTGLIL